MYTWRCDYCDEKVSGNDRALVWVLAGEHLVTGCTWIPLAEVPVAIRKVAESWSQSLLRRVSVC